LASFLVCTFVVIGIALGLGCYRWPTIPHWLDMCLGMLTFGNLGMLLGWWADNDFAPLLDGGCSHCVELMRQGVQKPWMWSGMLVGANAAMVWFLRCSTMPSRGHSIAMYTGGNAGMLAGMVAGAWCANHVPAGSVPLATCVSLVGMTVGMVGGMLLGTWVAERLLGLAQALPRLPRWFRTGLKGSSG
jgi:hypothetical protein